MLKFKPSPTRNAINTAYKYYSIVSIRSNSVKRQGRSFGGLAIVCAAILPLLGACATGADPGAMSAPVSAETLLPSLTRLRQTVVVSAVTGGEETNPLWMSRISSADFSEALRRSLLAHAMLAASGGTYRLEAQMLEVKQPFAGFNMEVTTTVRYRLIPAAGGDPVFDRQIVAAYSADFSSSFYGVTRLRLANEGAVRANISSFIRALVAEDRSTSGSFSPVVSELLPQLIRLAPS